MAVNVVLTLGLTGSDNAGPIAPVNKSIPIAGQLLHDFDAEVPSTGGDYTVPVPPAGTTQQLLLVMPSNNVGLKVNSETVPRTLTGGGAYLIVGGPQVTQLVFTPNGSVASKVEIKIIGT